MVRQAVIMAGGLGSRLKGRTEAMPKGLIEIDGVAMVERSIRKLIAVGIEEIVIGTGHCSEWYDRLAELYPMIATVRNDRYAETGSMGTLACCVPHLRGDCLVLESDLIYDQIALRTLLNDPRKNVVLASGTTRSGDEVYLEATGEERLKSLSKKREELGEVYGELVGISKLSLRALREMAAFCESERERQPKMEYETALVRVSRDSDGLDAVHLRKIDDLAWREIDDEDHLRMATETVFPLIEAREELWRVKREVLLNPGPATTTDSVKYAQVVPDICPRETEFGDVMEWVADALAAMVGKPEETEAVLFGGSGTAANEAMISSCIPNGAKTLIVDNGAYGARFVKIAEVYRLRYDVFKSSGTLPLDTEAVKQQLLAGNYTHFVAVWHETTTGLMNPIPELCRFCKEHNIVTIIDAVSAFSAIPIDLERDGVDFLSSTSNKNIQGMAGVCFVLCRKEALLTTRDYPMRNYYLNLWDQYNGFRKSHQMRFTPPVQTLYALRQAILETRLETVEGRYARYSACWEELVRAIEPLGLKMLVPTEAQSRLITAILEPANPRYNFEELHDFAKERGFTIYPGKLSDADTFRIANIGDIQPAEMARFGELLREYMERIG